MLARMAYWREFPPTHLLVRNIAIWAGAFKPASRAADPKIAQAENDAKLRAMFPTGKI
jgi:hypothetical protein